MCAVSQCSQPSLASVHSCIIYTNSNNLMRVLNAWDYFSGTNEAHVNVYSGCSVATQLFRALRRSSRYARRCVSGAARHRAQVSRPLNSRTPALPLGDSDALQILLATCRRAQPRGDSSAGEAIWASSVASVKAVYTHPPTRPLVMTRPLDGTPKRRLSTTAASRRC